MFKKTKLQLNGTDIKVKTKLTKKEVENLTDLMIGASIDKVRFCLSLPGADWVIRLATIKTYTDFDFNTISKPSDVVYDSPLYAMLVGCPEHPVHFEGAAYTEPAIDTEQYYAILDRVNDELEKFIQHAEQLMEI